ncbi:plasmid fertility inhibition factor family protein, partial [Burkholderia ubonensis]|uniref:plasmid fertility inhibition factor family protein n=1 Tax=Burkholderia ubonensis TaxID=101571 RepID=UPI0039F53380
EHLCFPSFGSSLYTTCWKAKFQGKLNARKLLACADRDTNDYVLPSVQYWHPGKLHGICAFLDPGRPRVPEMPYVTFRTRSTRTLLGLIGFSKEGVVSFRNGQHRARYMAFAGATCFPVEVHETEADLLQRYCGV